MFNIKPYINLKRLTKKLYLLNKKRRLIGKNSRRRFFHFNFFFVRKQYINRIIKEKLSRVLWSIDNFWLSFEQNPFFSKKKGCARFVILTARLMYLMKTVRAFYPLVFGREMNFFQQLFFLEYLSFYLDAFWLINFSFFFFFKRLLSKKIKPMFNFILSFKKNNRFFLNLQNNHNDKNSTNVKFRNNRNFSQASMGLFLKFFEKKKSLKSTKLIKLVAVKYFKKLLIASKIKKLFLTIKSNPVMLPEIINLYKQTVIIVIKIKNEETEEEEEVRLKLNPPKISYYFFSQNKSYVVNKYKKKGRIKRKITKKLINKNKIVD